jgi:DNA mismatch endonuclease (patch repair protein)
MADNLSPEDRRRTMQAVKSKATRIERKLWSMLAGMRVRGWRKNAADLPGAPDVAFDELRLALFVDGCFWHGCPVCKRPLPATRRDYWQGKIERNIERARRYNQQLQQMGWRVARFWEHELLRDPRAVRRRLRTILRTRRRTMTQQQTAHTAQERLDAWRRACTRRGKLSRNTLAAGVVALHQLRHAESLPASRETLFSAGGELKHSRGKSLTTILSAYGLPTDYLKEVTTRQAHQDAQRLLESLEWGALLTPLTRDDRDALLRQLIDALVQLAQAQLQQQAVRVRVDWRQSPWEWMRQILAAARERAPGVVEQHLVGAKLQTRFRELQFPTLPAHAADVATGRKGDFELPTASGGIVLHVTAHPTSALIEKCQENLRQRLLPIILTLREKEAHALALAEDKGVAQQIAVVPIEHFVATNLIEMATERQMPLDEALRALLRAYNQRVELAETNRSCKIELE